MVSIIIAIAGLLVIVALLTYFTRRKTSREPEKTAAPAADCCGAHEVCEKGLKKMDPRIEYFDDEELDAYRDFAGDAYTDEQIDAFRDILYTLRPQEIGDWLTSLEKRHVNLPDVLRQEALEMMG